MCSRQMMYIKMYITERPATTRRRRSRPPLARGARRVAEWAAPEGDNEMVIHIIGGFANDPDD